MSQRIKRAKGPERRIQDEFIKILKQHDWYVMETHGNMYQRGFPDLYICRRRYGTRWVECKVLGQYKFTASQTESFPRLASEGVGIWIIAALPDLELGELRRHLHREYEKLFGPPNFWSYWK